MGYFPSTEASHYNSPGHGNRCFSGVFVYAVFGPRWRTILSSNSEILKRCLKPSVKFAMEVEFAGLHVAPLGEEPKLWRLDMKDEKAIWKICSFLAIFLDNLGGSVFLNFDRQKPAIPSVYYRYMQSLPFPRGILADSRSHPRHSNCSDLSRRLQISAHATPGFPLLRGP